MRKGILFSSLMHAAALVLAVFGLPEMWKSVPLIDRATIVEIVDVSELTNVPPPKAEPDETSEEAKEDEPEPDPRKRPPPPEPEQAKPEEALAPPDPEAKKQDEPEPQPVQQARAVEKPRRRPKTPPSDFSSVLKTVEKIKRKRRSQERGEEPRRTVSASGRSIPDQPLTLGELDAIRQQFRRCWNVDVGAKDLATFVVSIRVILNPDRTVRDAEILDRVDAVNSYYRAFVESALRAVRNPRCSPVQLPPKKFQIMKTFTLRFSAKEMLGL